MDLNINMTMNLSEKDISNIIKAYLVNQGYKVNGEVDFSVGEKYVGCGMDEYSVTYFKGAKVSVVITGKEIQNERSKCNVQEPYTYGNVLY